MGNKEYKEKNYKAALFFYNRSLSITPSADVNNNRAITLVKLRQDDKALVDYNELIKMEPNNSKGICYYFVIFIFS